MSKARQTFVLLMVSAALLLSGCGDEAATPVPPTPTRLVRPTPPRPTAIPTPVAVATPTCNGIFFQETKRTVCQPFLDYWTQNGGLAIFGYPITDQVRETAKDTGETYIAQYFERSRFELHPSSGDQVILGRLGALVRKPDPAVTALPDALFFPETGHNLKGVFLKFWTDNGGLGVYGYPITEEIEERSGGDNRKWTVQYFERARFEYHPENVGTAFEVQLGQLGKQVYLLTYGR